METKNILRQNFIHEDVGRNKAEVLTERYAGLYSNVLSLIFLSMLLGKSMIVLKILSVLLKRWNNTLI